MNLPASLPLITCADFGLDFRWGCATSSCQIEGATTEDGRSEPIWRKAWASMPAVSPSPGRASFPAGASR